VAAEFLDSAGAVRRACRKPTDLEYQVRILRNNKNAYKLYHKKEMKCLWKAGLFM